MIGDGWDGDPSIRPGPAEAPPRGVRRIAVVTGTRAEFGLLEPVMRAILAREQDQQLAVVAAGAHLISPALTYRDVKAAFGPFIADVVPMQVAGRSGRAADVEALGRGVARFGRGFARLSPDWVVVLGDRIEAFAAASAASVGGFAVAHIHGGDRAEGVADEAMRHAITKLAHLHLPATERSAERIVRMGEPAANVLVCGSPAIDALANVGPLDDAALEAAGVAHPPSVVFLLHPIGRPAEVEEAAAALALEGLSGERVLAFHPNHDAGREGTLRAIQSAGVPVLSHLPRRQWVGLLRRLAADGGVLVGNSSAGLIEAAALGVPVVDIGPRQSGRERCANVVHTDTEHGVPAALERARSLDRAAFTHPYGDGNAGARIAAALAGINPHDPRLLRKHCAY